MKEKYNWKRGIPFGILLIVWSVYHILILPCFGDDANLFKGVLDNCTISEYLNMRYHEWSSRLLIEVVLVQMIKYPIIWKFADTAIMVAIVVMMSKLIDDDHKYIWATSAWIFIYPFLDMATAGWISTTLNYIWPMGGMLYLCLLLKKVMQGKQLKVYEYIVAAFTAMFSCNHEQVAAVVLALFLGFGIFNYMKTKRISVYVLEIIFLDIVSLIFILTCPGNSARMLEVGGTGFQEYSFVKKLELGMLNIERIFMAVPNFFLLTFVVFLTFLVWKLRKNLKSLLAILPIIFILIGYWILNRYIPTCKKIFVIPERSFDIEEFSSSTLWMLFMLLFMIGSILVSVFQILDGNVKQFLQVTFILATGFGSSVMLGLSPSVFDSDTRIFLFFYFSLIYTALYCWKAVRSRLQLGTVEKYIYIGIAFLWTSYHICYMISNIIGRRSWGA